MRQSRIYVDTELASNLMLTLPKEQAHYVAVVLRMKVGQELVIFNGRGGSYKAKLVSADKRSVVVELGKFQNEEYESPLCLTLAQGISRGQHMDYTIQKAVELGVSKIVPLFTEHGNVRLDEQRTAKRMQHWEKIIISACEQSGRNRLPELSRPMELNDWLTQESLSLRILFDPGAGQSLNRLNTGSRDISLLSGPEGGFSDHEMVSAYEQGLLGVRLGPRVLRTETAAVAALAAIQTLWGDMG